MLYFMPFLCDCLQGAGDTYYQGGSRFNLRAFWTDHAAVLPLHFAVYVAQVGCIKAAAAEVESVFSGAGKFTQEARVVSATLLR